MFCLVFQQRGVRIMIRGMLLAGALLAGLGVTGARAQIADDDPLHMCYSGGCTTFNGVTIGSGSQPSNSDLTGWGFSSSPASQSGALSIAILVPNTDVLTVLPTLSGTLNGSSLTISALTSKGTFSSGQFLTSVLGISASPPNPFSAYIGATNALD